MIAMIKKNLTKKTVLNVTMSTMTTRTIVLNWEFENDCKVFLFPQYKLLVLNGLFGFRGVAASSSAGSHDRVLISVVAPFFGNSYVILLFRRFFLDKLFQIGLRVSLFMHALVILLIIVVALHDRSAIVFVRGISVIFCS